MESTEQKNVNGKCFICGKEIKSLYNKNMQIIGIEEKRYKEQTEEGLGIYCPCCDHIYCLACAPTISSNDGKGFLKRLFGQSAAKNEISVNDIPLNDPLRKSVEQKLKEKGVKVVAVKCPSCNTYFGNLPADKENCLTEFVNKVNKNEELITTKEAVDVIDQQSLFISRMEKYDLMHDRVGQQRSAMEMILEKIAVPKLKQAIMAAVDNRQFGEAKNLYTELTRLVSLMKNNAGMKNDLSLIETIIKMKESTSGRKMTIELAKPMIFTVDAIKVEDSNKNK